MGLVDGVRVWWFNHQRIETMPTMHIPTFGLTAFKNASIDCKLPV